MLSFLASTLEKSNRQEKNRSADWTDISLYLSYSCRFVSHPVSHLDSPSLDTLLQTTPFSAIPLPPFPVYHPVSLLDSDASNLHAYMMHMRMRMSGTFVSDLVVCLALHLPHPWMSTPPPYNKAFLFCLSFLHPLSFVDYFSFTLCSRGTICLTPHTHTPYPSWHIPSHLFFNACIHRKKHIFLSFSYSFTCFLFGLIPPLLTWTAMPTHAFPFPSLPPPFFLSLHCPSASISYLSHHLLINLNPDTSLEMS